MNAIQVFVKTFIEPAKAFAALKEKPFVALAMTVMLLATLGTVWVVTTHLDEGAMRGQMREAMEKHGRTMTDAQLDEMMAGQAKFRWLGAPIATTGAAIVYLLVALVFFLVFKMLDSDMSYKQSLSVTVHGFLPGLIGAVLLIALILKAGTVDPQAAETLLKSNLGFLADPDSQKILFKLLSSIDLFSLWSLGLLTLGFGTVTGKGWKGALPVTVGLWALYLAGKIGLAMVFGR
ncbi:MAG TPA: hypothetical protein DCS11_08685 [Syntrophus sp. (in: bacteria)]|jgi:NADH:ubiquinone oxidoreductase subunit 6 (subunit J)|nr:hypothetical protein [Syntrophus sp. (in: bacteria)]